MPTTSKYVDPRLADWLGETDQGANEAAFTDPYAGAKPLITEEMIQQDKQIRADRAERERISRIPYGTPVSQGGTAAQVQVTQEPIGTVNMRTGYRNAPVSSMKVVAPAAPVGKVGGDPLAGLSDVEKDAATRSDQGARERDNALQGIIDRYDDIGLDTGQSDESRTAQQEAIRMNREQYRRASSFDKDAAAAKYSENALASALAVARSSPGAASREEALFNALSSMPSVQAEGQRQANEEGRAQDRQALQAAQQLGQQATATRSLDESRAETQASIGLDVAKGIADFTGLDLQLDQRDREFLGEVALAVARLNLDQERLSADQQIAAVQQELARQGLDQEYRMFKEGRKISDRDILGGIFSLGGAVVGGLATGGAG